MSKTKEGDRTNQPKAIETVYKGYRFRSRLEARWAVFFDALGFQWEYEPQGFILPRTKRPYLPDFRVKELGWIEIKPLPEEWHGAPWPPDDSLEAEFFIGPRIVGGIIYGTPGPVADVMYTSDCPYAACVGDTPYFFCECPHCGSMGLQFDGRSARNPHKAGCSVLPSDDKNYNPDSPRILAACVAFRSARFEYGESGINHR